MSGSNSCKSCWSVFDTELKLCPQCGADMEPKDQSANIAEVTVSQNVDPDVEMTIRRPELSSIIDQNLSDVSDAKNEEFLDQKNTKIEEQSLTNSTMDAFNFLGSPSLDEIAISNESHVQPNSSHFEPSQRNGAEMQPTGNPYGSQNFQNPNTPFSSYPQPFQGQYPYGVPVSVSTNGMAIASMIMGILWLYWLGSLMALIFGYIALSQIKRTREQGRGMAIAGVVLGWVGVVVLVVSIIFFIIASAAANNSNYGNSG